MTSPWEKSLRIGAGLYDEMHESDASAQRWRHRSVDPPAFRIGRHLRYDPAAVCRWLLEEAA